ncbi:MAG: hypothetical protein GWP08_14775 [Nitrospiraceae bacterium]|nr:hypothetical protein [Nitrospiraceae bacterium]
MAYSDHFAAVLLGETNQRDALRAVERYRDALKDHFDPRYSVVTYPADGHAPDALMEIADRRLQEAKIGDSGGVVFRD